MKTVKLKREDALLIASKSGVEGGLEIREARNNNDFLNNILPQAVSAFVNPLLKSLSYLKLKTEDSMYDMSDSLELQIKEDVQRWITKNMTDWIEEDVEDDIDIELDTEGGDFEEEDLMEEEPMEEEIEEEWIN